MFCRSRALRGVCSATATSISTAQATTSRTQHALLLALMNTERVRRGTADAAPTTMRRMRCSALALPAVRWCSARSNPNTTAESAASETTADNSADGGSATASPPPPKRKLQIAVVGSGPSGCFVASQLVKKHPTLHVDIFERLPVPFGLCRYGVAPDHPDVKNVEKQFMELFQGGRVTWIGNVTIGKEIPVQALLAHYGAVVFATGADGSKKLRIPGEDLGGVIPARSLVEYYNTYPFPFGAPRFCPFDLERTRKALVIGNGNVAMDVVRVLGGSYKYFCPTDMNCVCLRELMKNRIDHISIVGRRGVEHSAFATAEFRELTKYQEGHVRVEVDHFTLSEAEAKVPEGKTTRAHKRMMELVHQHVVEADAMEREYAQLATDREGVPLPSAAAAATSGPSKSDVAAGQPRADKRGPCTLRFRYNLTPVAILPSRHRKNYVGGVLFKKTRQHRKTETPSGSPAASGNATEGEEEAQDEYCVIPCDLVLTSIGYRADSISSDVPFHHAAGTIDNVHGRVRGMPRVYCSGWAKNGAKGVILHSVVDAQETVASVLADIASGVIPSEATAEMERGDDSEAAGHGREGSAATADRSDSSSSSSRGTSSANRSPAATTTEPELLVVESLSDRSRTPAAARPSTATNTTTTTMAGKYGLVDYFVEKKLQPVSVAGLQRIFYVEHQRGVDLGKKAEKIDTVRDMLDVALGGDVGRKADERIRRITPARSDAMMYLKELLDDDTDLAPLAHELAKDMPHRLAQQHPLGRISPSQL